MPDAALLARLSRAVDANFEAEVGFLADLVRFPSTRGNEAPLQDWMTRQLAARGYDVDRYTLADVPLAGHPKASPMVEADPARSVQVVATHRARAVPAGGPAAPAGRSLILQGHIDVVPAGPEAMWTYPPYSATIRDGWMYGRGAHDMKAGVAAMVFALDALRGAGLEPAADVHLQTVTEEESTGNGALSTLLRGYRADAALIPEPTGGTITRAHTGTLWFRIAVRGVPVHVAYAQTGTNAILSAYHLIQALQEHTRRINEEARKHPWYGDVDSPLKFNPGIIRGGDWASSTPAWCEVDCRIGLLPGTEVAEARAAVERCIAEAAKGDHFLANNPPSVTWHGFLADGYVLEPGTEAEAVLAAAHAQVFGEAMPARITTAVNDTRFYGLYFGIPGLCYGPRGEGAHAFDERTELEHLKRTTLAIAAFIADWCGTRPIG
ncbi:ArgE/DapE family deacylase [Roseicella aquatilis]|uniref:ArgE/DapE family deacylase n=1 Tax=Roseicella aquatilis TaxID=2527868 RepID=A0A4R4DHS8_9PROT|nr:ArgE/DapE family deacylase [Roseicella aquatilis]TCZ59825.1 ArgE/DapE family deacylase [Roseicella aquatilis]